MTTRLDPRTSGATVPGQRRRDPWSAARALGVALAAVAALVGVYVAFVQTHRGQRWDQLALYHLGQSVVPRDAVRTLLETVTVGGVAVILVVFVSVALVRRRWVLACAAVALVVGANLTTEVLKHDLLNRPDMGYGQLNSLPSGHMTVVASLILAGLLVVPRGARWLVALAGSLAVTVTAVGTVVAGWHRPSDVVAALAITLAWGALIVAVLALTQGVEESTRRTARPMALVPGLALAAALFIALCVRPDSTADLTLQVTTMCGLAVIGAGVIGLFAWMVDARFP